MIIFIFVFFPLIIHSFSGSSPNHFTFSLSANSSCERAKSRTCHVHMLFPTIKPIANFAPVNKTNAIKSAIRSASEDKNIESFSTELVQKMESMKQQFERADTNRTNAVEILKSKRYTTHQNIH